MGMAIPGVVKNDVLDPLSFTLEEVWLGGSVPETKNEVRKGRM